MATLAGSTIASTYTYLLKMDGTSGLTSSLVAVQDGDATDSALKISTGGIEVDSNFTGTTTATTKAAHIDFDATGITASGQTATNIGLDLDMNSNSPTMVGTVTNTGLDMDVVGGTSGTTKNIGIDVSVSGATTNYAALFSGGNVGIGTAVPGLALTALGALGNPATTGTTQTGTLRVGQSAGTYGMDMGFTVTGSANAGWIQTTDASALGTNLNLLLQPNGGNVGIGVIGAAPDRILHIQIRCFSCSSKCSFDSYCRGE